MNRRHFLKSVPVFAATISVASAGLSKSCKASKTMTEYFAMEKGELASDGYVFCVNEKEFCSRFRNRVCKIFNPGYINYSDVHGSKLMRLAANGRFIDHNSEALITGVSNGCIVCCYVSDGTRILRFPESLERIRGNVSISLGNACYIGSDDATDVHEYRCSTQMVVR